MTSTPRVALVHDWLTGMRGGEHVLEAIAELFPRAELFSLIGYPEKLSPRLRSLPLHLSWLARLPQVRERYRHYLPLMPAAVASLDVSGFDLVLSSSHCVAKGVRKRADAVHVSYIHAPMRYMWDRFDEYFGRGRVSTPIRAAALALRPAFRAWDRRVSQADRVNHLIGNSRFIATQIEAAYGRPAQVIYPFAHLERFQAARQPEDFYLIVSAFAPNKRVDLAIEAFNRLRLPLWIVGDGQDADKLKRLAGPTIRFFGSVSNEELGSYYARARAFIFPGLDDSGITPLEAMAAGCPVIAYGAGGALETVTEQTGLFFRAQTPEALMEAVGQLERGSLQFAETACRTRAHGFSKARFQHEYLAAVTLASAAAGKNWFK